jgi:hypothetical protein
LLIFFGVVGGAILLGVFDFKVRKNVVESSQDVVDCVAKVVC